jgi:hypothetical protein
MVFDGVGIFAFFDRFAAMMTGNWYLSRSLWAMGNEEEWKGTSQIGKNVTSRRAGRAPNML